MDERVDRLYETAQEAVRAWKASPPRDETDEQHEAMTLLAETLGEINPLQDGRYSLIMFEAASKPSQVFGVVVFPPIGPTLVRTLAGDCAAYDPSAKRVEKTVATLVKRVLATRNAPFDMALRRHRVGSTHAFITRPRYLFGMGQGPKARKVLETLFNKHCFPNA
jgi:hypothetical protein